MTLYIISFQYQNEIELLKESSENLLKDILSCQSQLSPQGNGKSLYHMSSSA